MFEINQIKEDIITTLGSFQMKKKWSFDEPREYIGEQLIPAFPTADVSKQVTDIVQASNHSIIKAKELILQAKVSIAQEIAAIEAKNSITSHAVQ